MYIVDIDVGGTLTDGIISGAGEPQLIKVDTTPHDFTVCFFDCLNEGATQLGFDSLERFLDEVQLIRWSTTITSNVLAERRGPKIGLIVTTGNEKDLYAQGTSPAIDYLVGTSNIIGIESSSNREEILAAVRHLLENGVRRICVSLAGAFEHPEREDLIREFVEEQYPDHYLGAVPVLLGSEIQKSQDDMTRTHCALINAYTHSSLATTLFNAEDRLRYSENYIRPFLINHINGGVATIAKTKAVDTMESGPILGLYASRYFAGRYGLDRVIALDVGGTTAKIGLILDGVPLPSRHNDLFGIPVEIDLPYLRSIALGGGSVVRAGAGITLGPDSMGSSPGPACYSLGTTEATLTDVFVASGIIDPENFLGGRKKLDQDRALRAIEENIAKKLGMSAEIACQSILEVAFKMVAEKIREALDDIGEDSKKFSLFAYGGNGGLFACRVAELLNIDEVFVFSTGPVFSAFGSSMSDLSHLYEMPLSMALGEGFDLDEFQRILSEMKTQALNDIQGEGFSGNETEFTAELEITDGSGRRIIRLPFEELENLKEPSVFRQKVFEAVPPDTGDFQISLLRLRAIEQISKPRIEERTVADAVQCAAGGARQRDQDGQSHLFTGRRSVISGFRNGKTTWFASIYRPPLS